MVEKQGEMYLSLPGVDPVLLEAAFKTATANAKTRSKSELNQIEALVAVAAYGDHLQSWDDCAVNERDGTYTINLGEDVGLDEKELARRLVGLREAGVSYRVFGESTRELEWWHSAMIGQPRRLVCDREGNPLVRIDSVLHSLTSYPRAQAAFRQLFTGLPAVAVDEGPPEASLSL